MCFGVSRSLTELGKGVGLWALGIERLTKSLWWDICLPCFYRVCVGWNVSASVLCVGCYRINN